MNWVNGAKTLLAKGFSVAPIPKMWLDPDHKDYKYSWKWLQERQMTPEEAEREFKKAEGIVMVCGKVSGNLLCIDFDSLGAWEAWSADVKSVDEGLFKRLSIEKSPKGRHVYFRLPSDPPGNEKWAYSNRGDGYECTVETRGEGGIVFCAPTPGYSWEQGSFLSVPAISEDEFQMLKALALARDERTEPIKPKYVPVEGTPSAAGDRPGDVFNQRADWRELLEERGATIWASGGGKHFVRRPGKKDGVSGTVTIGRNGHEVLYVFSSNWPDLESGKAYGKFAYYAATSHGGDYGKAARAVADMYGLVKTVRTYAPALSVEDGGAARELAPEADGVEWLADDWGNAQKFEQLAKGRLLYCAKWGRWISWDGKRWKTDEVGATDAYMLYMDMIGMVERSDKAHWKSLRAKARVEATLSIARNLPGLRVDPEDFDTDPWILNTQSGIVSLKTGEVIPHDPALMCSKICAAGVAVLGATGRAVDSFMSEIMDGREAMVSAWQRFCGHALIGNTREQKFGLLVGRGRNGKGVFLGVIEKLLGGYATTLDASIILSSKSERPLYALETLRGARVVTIEEPDKRRTLDREFIKKLVAGDSMMVAAKYGHPYTIRPAGTLFLAANHKPKVEFDYAFKRRAVVFPFDLQINDDEVDLRLEEKLLERGDEFMAWLVQGCLMYLRDGLEQTPEMLTELESYEEENDHLALFLSSMCVIDPSNTFYKESGELVGNYNDWAKDSGSPTMTRNDFVSRMKIKGWSTEKVGKVGRKGYRGIRLRGPDDED